MGKIGRALFGGPAKKESGNKAYDYTKEAFAPVAEMAQTGSQGLAALLGGDSTGFNAYKQATGFDAMADQGSRGVIGNQAARSLLRSGSTGQALQSFGQNLQNQSAGQYMQQLLGLAGLGTQAGQLIGQTGQYSKEEGKKDGILGPILSAASMAIPGAGPALTGAGKALSDPRLKMNVEKLAEFDDGLGVYAFSYIWENPDAGPIHIGVMADEVSELRPWALGPEEDGFMTVQYDKLGTES